MSTTRALPHHPSGTYRNRSIGSGRLQEHDHLGTVLGRCEPAIRLHVVAGHNLIGFRDEAIEVLLVPYKVRALHGAGIAVVLKRTGFPSDDIVEVRTQAIVAFLDRVAGPACVVECLLPRLGVGALSRRLLEHGRETQKHQECGADQSRDCGAGHDVLLAIERASPHGGLAAARYHTVAPERRCASQQKLRADVAFTSFPPSRRVRFAPRADVRPMPALALASAGKQLLPAATPPARGAATCPGRWRQPAGHRSCCP